MSACGTVILPTSMTDAVPSTLRCAITAASSWTNYCGCCRYDRVGRDAAKLSAVTGANFQHQQQQHLHIDGMAITGTDMDLVCCADLERHTVDVGPGELRRSK